MKNMVAGLFVLLLVTSAYAKEFQINVLAVDESTPAGQSVEGVKITAYYADTKNVIASATTTKEGLTAAEGADFSIAILEEVAFGRKNFYFYGSKDGTQYLESDPPPVYYVDVLSGKLCTADTNECRSIYDSDVIIVLKAPKLSKTSIITIMAKDEISGQGIDGIYLKIIDAETKEILSSGVTNINGLMLELPLDKKFEIITAVSKDGRNYGDFQILNNGWSNTQFYLEQKENDIELCRLGTASACSLAKSIILKPLDELAMPESIADTILTEDGLDFEVNLNAGWNLISVPLNEAKAVENTCSSQRIYVYDSNISQYNWFSLNTFSSSPMQAFWIKTTEGCKIKFHGKELKHDAVNGLALNKGWNAIGAASNGIAWNEIQGSCKAKGGLWSYNTKENKWEKARSLVRGKGYLVNLLDECSLGV